MAAVSRYRRILRFERELAYALALIGGVLVVTQVAAFFGFRDDRIVISGYPIGALVAGARSRA